MENEHAATESPVEDAAPQEQAAADPAARLAALAAERDQLEADKIELNDRLLRRAAEFENFRRRVERERAELLEFAASAVAGELLPVLDDFERALKVESADKEYARGMELIYQRLLEVLKRSGLEPLVCENQKFDPHLHHAVEMAPSEEVEDQTILEERRRGYKFRGRLLRPALVKVAVRP
ncbi:MAG: nucleotide exchange factor GrpE [Acidobacteria bacterium]|nr:nucleotide exchange factor GrpE [Acidobacteriota bacterium]